MLRNYLKIAWRNLLQDRLFTFLNLIGLSLGLACIVMIYLWVNDELTIDKFHANDRRLYQIMRNLEEGPNDIQTYENNSDLLVPALAAEMPEIEHIVPTSDGLSDGIVSVDDKHVKAVSKFAGADFFNVFSYSLIRGNKNQVLRDENSIVISDELAANLFGSTENAINKLIHWNEGKYTGNYKIAGVFEKPQHNSSETFDILLTNELYLAKSTMDSNWDSNRITVYITLKEGVDADKFNAKIKEFVRDKFKAANGTKNLHWIGRLFLQRYSDKYLHNVYVNGVPTGGRIEYVKLFSVIALFILIIACINFMNLSTAKASKRMKEVGVKKVVGATRSTLVFQYLGESTLMSFLSLLVALLLVSLALPVFNDVTGKQLSLSFDPKPGLIILIITLITGLLAGSYPAFYLSGFKPVTVLKGKLQTSLSQLWIRKGLVVFQFALSVLFIVGVLVIYKQMEFVQTKNLGYNKENIIHFSNEGKIKDHQQAFLAEVKAIPDVVNASSMSGDLIGSHSGGGGIDWEGKTERVEFSGLYVDYDLVETLNLNVTKGRSFSRNFGSDSSKVIFNEAAIAAMGLKNPIGKTVTMWGAKKQIVGIIKDFNFESLYKKVAPFFLSFEPHASNILVKIKAGKEKAVLSQIEQLYKRYNQGLPFDYKFVDQDYQTLYASEQRVAVLSRYFAGLAIVISCLGLFGLTAFTAQRRQKEIGIRKVVGASADNIVVMLSKDFLKLVVIAMVIAFPVAGWVVTKWLSTFAYRIDVGASIYLLTGTSIIAITLLVVSYQSIKAAIMNPVTSLRSE
ncbi:FtsX-like permease family protein [Spirosoma sp. HMF4905]|uniref:FtsX-like permease family protein n=2 Tax=Spirosoma arboris TaxID=2682092 RepID=A0A7K1SJ08_9BACT|nr:FtsX-like permease family protein [Spirosoma arboris]